MAEYIISYIAKFEKFVMETSTILIRVKQYRNIILLYSRQAVDGAAKKIEESFYSVQSEVKRSIPGSMKNPSYQ
ncbi:hypothetical protein [Solibacillus sp. NPDC093137]|uniref:hypothetical protein n=1 Tax=Solibacillus sp. NPDC093137 TaxID=3390678 RepID=UPI003D03B0DD